MLIMRRLSSGLLGEASRPIPTSRMLRVYLTSENVRFYLLLAPASGAALR